MKKIFSLLALALMMTAAAATIGCDSGGTTKATTSASASGTAATGSK